MGGRGPLLVLGVRSRGDKVPQAVQVFLDNRGDGVPQVVFIIRDELGNFPWFFVRFNTGVTGSPR